MSRIQHNLDLDTYAYDESSSDETISVKSSSDFEDLGFEYMDEPILQELNGMQLHDELIENLQRQEAANEDTSGTESFDEIPDHASVISLGSDETIRSGSEDDVGDLEVEEDEDEFDDEALNDPLLKIEAEPFYSEKDLSAIRRIINADMEQTRRDRNEGPFARSVQSKYDENPDEEEEEVFLFDNDISTDFDSTMSGVQGMKEEKQAGSKLTNNPQTSNLSDSRHFYLPSFTETPASHTTPIQPPSLLMGDTSLYLELEIEEFKIREQYRNIYTEESLHDLDVRVDERVMYDARVRSMMDTGTSGLPLLVSKTWEESLTENQTLNNIYQHELGTSESQYEDLMPKLLTLDLGSDGTENDGMALWINPEEGESPKIRSHKRATDYLNLCRLRTQKWSLKGKQWLVLALIMEYCDLETLIMLQKASKMLNFIISRDPVLFSFMHLSRGNNSRIALKFLNIFPKRYNYELIQLLLAHDAIIHPETVSFAVELAVDGFWYDRKFTELPHGKAILESWKRPAALLQLIAQYLPDDCQMSSTGPDYLCLFQNKYLSHLIRNPADSNIEVQTWITGLRLYPKLFKMLLLEKGFDDGISLQSLFTNALRTNQHTLAQYLVEFATKNRLMDLFVEFDWNLSEAGSLKLWRSILEKIHGHIYNAPSTWEILDRPVNTLPFVFPSPRILALYPWSVSTILGHFSSMRETFVDCLDSDFPDPSQAHITRAHNRRLFENRLYEYMAVIHAQGDIYKVAAVSDFVNSGMVLPLPWTIPVDLITTAIIENDVDFFLRLIHQNSSPCNLLNPQHLMDAVELGHWNLAELFLRFTIFQPRHIREILPFILTEAVKAKQSKVIETILLSHGYKLDENDVEAARLCAETIQDIPLEIVTAFNIWKTKEQIEGAEMGEYVSTTTARIELNWYMDMDDY